MELVTVIENTTGTKTPELECEPGLSFYLEYNGKKILFDTGVSEKMTANAGKLNRSQGKFLITGLKRHIQCTAQAPGLTR